MNLLKSWDFMRVLRLILGAFALVQSIITSDIVLGVLGSAIGIMAIYNIGCCGSGGCNTNYKSTKPNKAPTDIDFTEVK